MSNEFDLRLETVIDSIIHIANEEGVDITVHNTFKEEDPRAKSSAIVQNIENNKFGIISTNVVEYQDEPICFFVFNGQLFDYCRAEGFEKENMLECFPDKVLKKVDIKDFVSFVIGSDGDK